MGFRPTSLRERHGPHLPRASRLRRLAARAVDELVVSALAVVRALPTLSVLATSAMDQVLEASTLLVDDVLVVALFAGVALAFDTAAILGEEGRCVHDRLARTYVVDA